MNIYKKILFSFILSLSVHAESDRDKCIFFPDDKTFNVCGDVEIKGEVNCKSPEKCLIYICEENGSGRTDVLLMKEDFPLLKDLHKKTVQLSINVYHIDGNLPARMKSHIISPPVEINKQRQGIITFKKETKCENK